MKYLKMLGLAVMAAAALSAFLGAVSASATVLCKTASNPCPSESRYPAGTRLAATLRSGTSVTWENNEPVDTCTGSSLKVASTLAGGLGIAIPLTVEELLFTGCITTNDVINRGEMKLEWISGTHNGTLMARGTSGIAAGGCSWSLPEWTAIGTVIGGNPALIEIKMPIPQICFWNRMTATYTVTSPTSLYVEGS